MEKKLEEFIIIEKEIHRLFDFFHLMKQIKTDEITVQILNNHLKEIKNASTKIIIRMELILFGKQLLYRYRKICNVSFSCSLRMGEMLGLTWDCVNISDEAVANNSCSLYINKEQQRVNKKVMSELSQKDVILVYPESNKQNKTVLVLKAPKTKSSVRKVFLPSTVVEMLKKKKEQIEEMKRIYGGEYLDYNLVFCHPNGRPLENSYIRAALNRLIKEHNLPKVVFHSFRHASITYKLKWNGGDMKSVQGDSGHAQLDMIADVYSHIIDEDRRFNAQKFEEQFYQTKGIRIEEGQTVPTPSFEAVSEREKTSAYKEKVEKPEQVDISSADPSGIEVLTKLLANPETAALLKALAKNM